MPNIPKWGQLNGTLLAQKYNLSQFLLINDFEAASYGLLIVE
jgi:glucokinase